MDVLDPFRLRAGTEIIRQDIVAAGSTTIDRKKGQHVRVTLGTSIVSLAIQNWPASGISGQLHLEVLYLGPHTITWPAAVKWPGGVAPALTGVNGKTDHFMLVTSDNGATIHGFVMGLNI